MPKNGATNGASLDAALTGTAIGTFPKVGVGLCQTIQAIDNAYKEPGPIHCSGHGLLYQMGGGQSSSR